MKHARWKYLVAAVYALLTSLAIFYHEPWRDEAQAWLIARDVPFLQLFGYIHYEGTPALWHVLLSPFARSGAPYFTMHVLHVGIAIGAVCVFLFKSPFPWLLKVCFVFSFFMFWEYAIIARSYSLSVLLLFLLASCYQDRHDIPLRYAGLLFLLINTNVHSFPIAATLCLLFLLERLHHSRSVGTTVLPALIMGTGALLVLLQLLPSEDTTNRGLFYIFSWRAPFIALAGGFFPELPRTLFITIGTAVLLVCMQAIVLYKRSPKAFLIFAVSCAGLFYIFLFKHTGSLRHHGFLLIALLFALWISSPSLPGRLERIAHYSLTLSIALSIVFAGFRHGEGYTTSFSGAKEAAVYIRANPGAVLVGHPSIKASAIAPYLPEASIWYPDIESVGTYITWNDAYNKGKALTVSQALGRTGRRFPTDSLLIILDQPIPDSFASSYSLRYQSSRATGYGEESFYLYAPN